MCVVSNLVHRRPLSAPEGPAADPGGAKGRGSRRMFWDLAPGDVIGKPVELQYSKSINAWKRRMEEASSGCWIEHEHNPRAMQLREYTLKEFCENFVDDRPFGADAICRQVNVQSEAVFSYPMTLMDKIRGCEDEERWVGSMFAACMWVYTKEAFTSGQILDREQERVPEETHKVHYALHELGLCRRFRRS